MDKYSVSFCACIFSAMTALNAKPDLKRPNILLILADDMGYSDIGCYGGEISTPNIDRLCEEGMKFTQCYNASRSCPSRASLLTGMYHHKAGMGGMTDLKIDSIYNYQGFLGDRCMTIAELLRSVGYKTYMSGKWHLGNKKGCWPSDRGFDRSFVFLNGAGSYYYPNGKGDNPKISSMAVDSSYYYPSVDGYYHTQAFTENAVKYIEEHNSSSPFFMYLSFTAPHWPLQAPKETIRKYDGKYDDGWDKLRVARYERMKKLGIINDKCQLSDRNPAIPSWDSLDNSERKYWADVMEVYAAVVEEMDNGIGEVLEALDKKGELDNTVIFFLSDNGGCSEKASKFADMSKYTGEFGSGDSFLGYEAQWANLSNAPFRFFKHWMHEGGISTPLIIRYPDMINRGVKSDTPVHIIDIFPTCLELGETTYPLKEQPQLKSLDGKSLLPLFGHPEKTLHDYLLFEHLGYRALRKGDYKIVSTYPDQSWELYNIENDRSELKDLSREKPVKLRKMIKKYDKEAEKAEILDWNLLKGIIWKKNKK